MEDCETAPTSEIILAKKYKDCFTSEQWNLFAELCGHKNIARNANKDFFDGDVSFLSSKVAMLLQDLKLQNCSSQHYVGPASTSDGVHAVNKAETLGKFVVLTSWTGFMRIIASKLQKEGFKIAQLHGKMSTSQRTHVLKSFDKSIKNGGIQGLVATTGTVGVGKLYILTSFQVIIKISACIIK